MPVTRPRAVKMEDTLKQLMEMIQDLKKGYEDIKKSQQDFITEMKKINSSQTEMKANQTKVKERFQTSMNKLEESITSRLHDSEETVEDAMSQMKTEVEKNVQVENKFHVVEDKFHILEEHVASLRNEVSGTEDKHNELKKKIMKNLEATHVKLSTSDAIKVDGSVTTSSRVKPPTFDGKVSWGTYLRQFEAAAIANNWSDEEKATSLIMALRGEAVEVLRTVLEIRQEDYTALAAALEMRHGELHLQQVYQAQLKGRRQRYNETLQQYAADIARSCQGRIRQINIGRQDQNFNKKMYDLVRFIQDLFGNKRNKREEVNSSTFLRRLIYCWNCGAEGHLRNRCPKNEDSSQGPAEGVT